MTIGFEEQRDEFRRLKAMGIPEIDEPTPRQMLVARQMRPHLWNDHAEEHVSWVVRHRLTGQDTYFGTQILILRRLMLMKAAEMLRRLDRDAAGLPDLGHFDSAEVCAGLRAEVMTMPAVREGARICDRAADEVFGMHALDGIADPAATIADDGVVTLTWREDDRAGHLVIETDRRVTLTTTGDGDERRHLAGRLPDWSHDGAVLHGIVEWVHHGGPRPAPLPNAETAA